MPAGIVRNPFVFSKVCRVSTLLPFAPTPKSAAREPDATAVDGAGVAAGVVGVAGVVTAGVVAVGVVAAGGVCSPPPPPPPPPPAEPLPLPVEIIVVELPVAFPLQVLEDGVMVILPVLIDEESLSVDSVAVQESVIM